MQYTKTIRRIDGVKAHMTHVATMDSIKEVMAKYGDPNDIMRDLMWVEYQELNYVKTLLPKIVNDFAKSNTSTHSVFIKRPTDTLSHIQLVLKHKRGVLDTPVVRAIDKHGTTCNVIPVEEYLSHITLPDGNKAVEDFQADILGVINDHLYSLSQYITPGSRATVDAKVTPITTISVRGYRESGDLMVNENKYYGFGIEMS